MLAAGWWRVLAYNPPWATQEWTFEVSMGLPDGAAKRSLDAVRHTRERSVESGEGQAAHRRAVADSRGFSAGSLGLERQAGVVASALHM